MIYGLGAMYVSVKYYCESNTICFINNVLIMVTCAVLLNNLTIYNWRKKLLPFITYLCRINI